MRIRHSSIRAALVAALAVFAFAAVASSAMATVSVQPLNTAFSSSATTGEASFSVGGIVWTCSKPTLSGTTNATKTNYVNATDSFTGCILTVNGGSNAVTTTNTCKTEGTIPWTITFNEVGTAALKLNCSLSINLHFGSCKLTLPPQTLESGISWKDWGTLKENLEINSKFTFKTLETSIGCEETGIANPESKLSLSDLQSIKGIHVS